MNPFVFAVDCSLGTFSSFYHQLSQCHPCGKGTYGTGRALSWCTECPPNTSTLTEGATSKEDCIGIL